MDKKLFIVAIVGILFAGSASAMLYRTPCVAGKFLRDSSARGMKSNGRVQSTKKRRVNWSEYLPYSDRLNRQQLVNRVLFDGPEYDYSKPDFVKDDFYDDFYEE